MTSAIANDEREASGLFVVFEGIDGAGTTTQAERLAVRLRSERRLAHVTREPTGGPIGALIRQILTHRVSLPVDRHAETMALLFAADRLDHVATEIAPMLRDGAVLISDRYDLSSLTYQSVTATGTDAAASLAWIRELNRHARRPDVTLVIDVSPDVAAARRRARGGKIEIFEEATLQARLAEAYRRAEEYVPGDLVLHIDGDAEADAVTARVTELLAPFLQGRA